jgi:hypothetical protein
VSQVALLLRLDARRASDAFRHPRVGAWVAVLLPAVLVVAALWRAGSAARADVADGQGRILLALLASVAPALWAYPFLFRPADDGLLRRLGIAPHASFAVRAVRIALLSLGAVALLMVPYVATGERLALPLTVALASACAAWGVSLWTHAGAARALATPGRKSALRATIGGFDPELASAAPLVYAPILPALTGVIAGRFASVSMDGVWWRLPLVVLLAAALAALARERFAEALPRFAPRAKEMAFAPAPGVGETGLVIGRGLARVLPRRAGAVRARDAAVVGRRFRWTGRAVWPVAIGSVLALLRAGESASVQAWVVAAGALVLASQAVAVVALGRVERGGPRWIDRASGIRAADRLAGRWALGFGLSLGLVIPVGLAWAAFVPASPGWAWPVASAAVATLASVASLAAAGR